MVRLPTLEPRATFEPGLKGLREPKVIFEPRATFEPGPKGLREPKATFEPRVLEPRATIVPKCMYMCDIISWMVRLPTFKPRVLEPRAIFEPGRKGLR